MTYASLDLRALGEWSDIGWSSDYHEFWQYKWSGSELYAYRFLVSGMPAAIESTSQVYPLVKAYVQSLAVGDRNQDIRGITLMPAGSPGQYRAEIVITDAGGVHLNGNEPKVAAAWMNKALYDAGLPLRVSEPAMTKVNEDNKAAYSLWFGQSPIWSYRSFDAAGGNNIDAGFTRAYLDGRGVWLNSTAAKAQFELQPRKQPEIAPPSPLQPSGPGATQPEAAAPDNFKWYLLSVAALGVAAAFAMQRKQP